MMLDKKILHECVQDLNAMPFNLKAEIIANLLYDRGVSSENLMIEMNSAFNRPFRRDVEKAKMGMDEEWEQLSLFLSRNGIYDLLPEGIVHERNEGSGRENIQELIQRHQKEKREEKEARKFFKPFENELFRMLVKIEQQEVSLLKNQDQQFQNILVQFWGINNELSEAQKQFLLKITPLANSLKGNIDKICKVLQVALGKSVSYKKELICLKRENPSRSEGLILGKNFVVGNATEELPLINFQISEVKDDEIKEYLVGGSMYNFIIELLEYLLPVEYELEINCETDQDFLSVGFGVLGYSSVLKS